MKKLISTLLLMVVSVILVGCTEAVSSTETTLTTTGTSSSVSDTTTTTESSNQTTQTTINSTEENTTLTTTIPVVFDYLYEDTPLDEAQLFGPAGYLSNSVWHWHGTPVFTPDGTEMYWSKYIKATNETQIWFTREMDGIWNEPTKFQIEGIVGAYNCPVFTKDGTEMYFLNFDGASFTIYRLTREGDAWIHPVAIDITIPEGKMLGWSFSISDNKNLYFLLWDLNGLDHQKIYRSIYDDGVYGIPQPLDILGLGSNGVGGPSIASDESYIIFDAVRSDGFGQHDLYISFKNELGEFSTPINLGNQVNSSEEDAGATISCDGQYLFFTTLKTTDLGYNPYWIKLAELEIFHGWR